MHDEQEFQRIMRQLERDAAYADDRTVLANVYGVPFDDVMDAVKGTAGVEWDDGRPSDDFRDAPQNLSDPELAAWAVDKLKRIGKIQ